MKTDLTFITNEKERRLLDRFIILIKDTKFFDVLVGYFYMIRVGWRRSAEEIK